MEDPLGVPGLGRLSNPNDETSPVGRGTAGGGLFYADICELPGNDR